MDGVQAVDLIASWRKILIEGKAEQIASLLEDLEERLKSKGFERDAEAEKNMNWHPYATNRVLCFVGGPEGCPRLLLCLNRVSERRVRGGRTLSSMPPPKPVLSRLRRSLPMLSAT